ncbi:uncharacterized protein A1O9_09360 [Exophiala aquamarina CBS 119918]|uniref:Ubiquitin-like domain-containing protein n=1 Tax=Exophiala aquamarina CBS 119918 TaxID=1182545 RepID=A0A072P5B4_9EURO|nr:uncharacterized protein A1O9_09360 [Exophiala aquamarina CBS 119918]KEF54917.1 hypothetical protein A1O9_09360 [Exophiala aquamarina CBS 119918]
MGDLQFAKQFLNTLDGKPTKYQPDHVFDPKTFQLRVPYTLPKLSNPPHPSPPKKTPSAAPAPGSEAAAPTVSITLKSARNPNMTLELPSLNPETTTIQSLKEQIQSHLGGPSVVGIDKVKILMNKKPVPPSKKTVSDAWDNKPAGHNIEFGVMIMGGAPDPPTQQPPTVPASATGTELEKATPMEGVEATRTASEPVQPGVESGASVLESAAFWDDLQGFLEQRIRDQSEAQALRGIFEKAWRSANSAP